MNIKVATFTVTQKLYYNLIIVLPQETIGQISQNLFWDIELVVLLCTSDFEFPSLDKYGHMQPYLILLFLQLRQNCGNNFIETFAQAFYLLIRCVFLKKIWFANKYSGLQPSLIFIVQGSHRLEKYLNL